MREYLELCRARVPPWDHPWLFVPFCFCLNFTFFYLLLCVHYYFHIDWDCRWWHNKCVLWLQPWYAIISFFCTTQFLSLFINLEILVHSSRLDNLISSWLCLCYMASNQVSCVNQYVSWYMCYFHHTVILQFRFNDPMGSRLQDGFFW